MILLDTNIISEMMRTHPSEKVVSWLKKQPSTSLFISTITIAEISYGLHNLPNGSRRAQLEKIFTQFIRSAFLHRVLSFDLAAAQEYGAIMAKRKEKGRPMSTPDGQIAAIAASQHLILATRNTRDFQECNVILINPFD